MLVIKMNETVTGADKSAFLVKADGSRIAFAKGNQRYDAVIRGDRATGFELIAGGTSYQVTPDTLNSVVENVD